MVKVNLTVSIDHEIKRDARKILFERNEKMSNYLENCLLRLILEQTIEKEVKEDGVI